MTSPPQSRTPALPELALGPDLVSAPHTAPALVLRTEPPLVEAIPVEPGDDAPAVTSDLHALATKADERLAARHNRLLLKPYNPERDANGKFVGVGNPAGRPPSFRRYLREMTGGGLELLDHAVAALRGSVTVRWVDNVTGELRTQVIPADAKIQAEARHFLAHHGLSAADVEVSAKDEDEEPIDLSKLSADELRTLLQLQRKIEQRPAEATPRVSEEKP